MGIRSKREELQALAAKRVPRATASNSDSERAHKKARLLKEAGKCRVIWIVDDEGNPISVGEQLGVRCIPFPSRAGCPADHSLLTTARSQITRFRAELQMLGKNYFLFKRVWNHKDVPFIMSRLNGGAGLEALGWSTTKHELADLRLWDHQGCRTPRLLGGLLSTSRVFDGTVH